MERDHRRSTAVHEAAHAAMSHLLGENFVYVEVTDARNGIMMPYHSPCPTCDREVPELRACGDCLSYYEKHDPDDHERSRAISRAYRTEAAVAAAGELAEFRFNNGVLLADPEELSWDRDRVRTRASLRHLWQEDACSSYCSDSADCPTCAAAAEELRSAVRQTMFASDVWEAVVALADKLADGERLSGDEVVTLMQSRGIAFGAIRIDDLWSPLHK